MNKELNIEKVEIRKIQDKGNLKAYVKATINNLSISDMKIVEGQNGLFVSMPSREYMKDGVKKYSSIVYLDEKQREELNKAVLSKYNGESVQAVQEPSGDNTQDYVDFGQAIELNEEDYGF